MEVILDYYDSYKFFNNKVIIVEDDIDCFEQFYKLNNSLRYCNGSYYKFNDLNWDKQYKDWLRSDDFKKKHFNLFYGKNGIVD